MGEVATEETTVYLTESAASIEELRPLAEAAGVRSIQSRVLRGYGRSHPPADILEEFEDAVIEVTPKIALSKLTYRVEDATVLGKGRSATAFCAPAYQLQRGGVLAWTDPVEDQNGHKIYDRVEVPALSATFRLIWRESWDTKAKRIADGLRQQEDERRVRFAATVAAAAIGTAGQ